jgi:hypothetical protein
MFNLGRVGRSRGVCRRWRRRGIGGRGVRLDLRVGSNTLIGDISNKAVVVVSSVPHMLDPAVGKGNRVGPDDITDSISRLGSVEVGLGVVILDSILVSVRLPRLRSRGIDRLGRISRSGCIGRSWHRDRSRGIGGGRRGMERKGGRDKRRNWNWSWCNMNRGMGMSMSVVMGVVTAVRTGTGHSHQGTQHNNLEKIKKIFKRYYCIFEWVCVVLTGTVTERLDNSTKYINT